ncbi:hypothetical protein FQR65_LT09031 [Abscondita terminalis]|nr:hypothetical protein FQR65_LT09031 [Abscondita terminalis]
MIAGVEGEPSAAPVTVPGVSMMASHVAQSSQSLVTVFGKSFKTTTDLNTLRFIFFCKDKRRRKRESRKLESQHQEAPIEITESLTTARPPKKRNAPDDGDADTRTALLPKDGEEENARPSYSTVVNDIEVHAEDK